MGGSTLECENLHPHLGVRRALVGVWVEGRPASLLEQVALSWQRAVRAREVLGAVAPGGKDDHIMFKSS